jgi:hypothetical protein
MSIHERAVPVPAEVELRSTETGHAFRGYAAVFGRDSALIGGRYVEQVAPGAFSNDLARPNRKTLVRDHDEKLLIASTASGHLRLAEDSTGLLVEAPTLPDTSYVRDLRELYERGEVSGMSFEFSANRGGVSWSDDGKRRVLTSVRLWHVSVLTGLTPAYADTTVEMRAVADAIDADPAEMLLMFDALREGRRLTDDEFALVRRALDAVAPEPPAVRARLLEAIRIRDSRLTA